MCSGRRNRRICACACSHVGRSPGLRNSRQDDLLRDRRGLRGPPGYVAPLTCGGRETASRSSFARCTERGRSGSGGTKGPISPPVTSCGLGSSGGRRGGIPASAPRRAGFSTGASTEPLVSPVRTASVMDFGSVGIGEFGSFDRPSPNDDRPRFDPIQPSDGPPPGLSGRRAAEEASLLRRRLGSAASAITTA